MLSMDQQVWNNKVDLRDLVPAKMRIKMLSNMCFSGIGQGGLRTGFRLGDFNLDAGHSFFGSWHVLLISHGHADHVFSLGSFFLVKKAILAERDAHVFSPNVHRVIEYAQALMKMDYDTDAAITLPVTFHDSLHHEPPSEGTPISIGNSKYMIKTRLLRHRIPAIGYFVSKYTERLVPELLSLKESALEPSDVKSFRKIMKDLRNGVPYHVSDDTIITKENMYAKMYLEQFCFLTDTGIGGIDEHIELIKTHPIIVVECTFYHIDLLDSAIKKTHIHWLQLEPHIRANPDNLWVLIHNSPRYSDIKEIEDAIRANYCDPRAMLQVKDIIPSNCLIWI
jgi:ribonuclease BN (tRNA processing enzyme)